MKAVHSEEYFRKYWDKLLPKNNLSNNKHHINLEAWLEDRMEVYKDCDGVAEEAIIIIRNIEATKIADECEKMLRDDMRIIKAVNEGKATFGFTTMNQETAHRADFVERFEFNCLQLADFRKKYNLA